MRRSIRLVFALLIVACSQPTETSIDKVDLTVRPNEVAAGDSLTATLVNRSNRTIDYSFCPTALERRVDGGWLSVQQPFGVPEYPRSACVGIGYTLPPGGTAEYRQLVTEDVDAGLYRLRMNVGASHAASSRLYSSEFRITQ